MADPERPYGLDHRAKAAATLERLGTLLDCPVEVFTDGVSAPRDVRQTRELMQLWTGIDDEDREEVLSLARKLAKA